MIISNYMWFILAKRRIRTGRGTRIIELMTTIQLGQETISKTSRCKKKKLSDKYITVGRGTGKIRSVILKVHQQNPLKVCG